MVSGGEGSVENPVSCGDGEREDDAVRPVHMTQGGLSGEAGNGLLGLPQSVSVYGVAVLGQQPGKPLLPQVAAHHPYVQFVLHKYLQNRRRRGGGFLLHCMEISG